MPTTLLALGLVSGCGAHTVSCVRAESIAVQLRPRKQLNQDRDGYSRSVVMRLYQLDSAEQFRAVSFEDIWRTRESGTPQKPVVVAPMELTLVPGKREERRVKRAPDATYLAVVANFREHQAGSGWQAVYRLPQARDLCPESVREKALEVGAERTAARIEVELKDYGLQLR